MENDHNRYEHSEKYRAELFKLGGLALFTPFCATMLSILTKDLATTLEQEYIWLRITISFLIAVLGFFSAAEGHYVMLKLDRRVSQCK
jgi:UDP-N-acetylmuramyl pentapeptide phosphotransferase/UDP-N-acetylglucosamine-1-phosphate transferase